MAYKYETHLHTSEGSACASSTSKEMVNAAVEHNYSGIIITEHFPSGNTCFDRNLPWKDFVSAYADVYYKAKEYGNNQILSVTCYALCTSCRIFILLIHHKLYCGKFQISVV